MKQCVTLTHLSAVTAVVDLPADASDDDRREAVLQLCDDGVVGFEAVMVGQWAHEAVPDGECTIEDPDTHWWMAHETGPVTRGSARRVQRYL